MSLKQLTVLFALMLSVVLPATALGQEIAPAPEMEVKKELTSAQLEELEKWLEDDAKHQKWYKRFGNQVRVHFRHRPDPPVWLEAECLDLIGGEGTLVKACALLHEIHEGEQLTKIRKSIEAQRSQNDTPVKAALFQRINIGGGWIVIDNLQSIKYGAIVETHVTPFSIGRFEPNLPGIMFMTVPDLYGNRTYRTAIHYGASIKLKTFRPLWYDQKYMAHLNFVNARVMNGFFKGFSDQRPFSLMGLSFTPKK